MVYRQLRKNKKMIIINLTGGLGNQMFQYAFGRYLSLKNKTELKYHFTNALFNIQRSYELDVFNIKAKPATDKDLKKLGVFKNRIVNRILYLIDERLKIRLNKNTITDRPPHKLDLSLFNSKNDYYLQGYWPNTSYLNQIERVIRKDFTFKKKLDQRNKNILSLIKKTNSISVHVRRTDYITNKRNKHKFIGFDYYKKSVDGIVKQINNPVFFIFSDDITWCTKNFKFSYPMHFFDHNQGKNSYKDMLLMSNCRHNIIANSTFSWWASWLNINDNKIVIKT